MAEFSFMPRQKKDWRLTERALTLYSTGKFSSRAEAMKAAKEERAREQAKQEQAKKDFADTSGEQPPF